MRTRIIIVVLGLSLGLGARFGYDLYQRWQNPPPSQPTTPAAKPLPAKSAARPVLGEGIHGEVTAQKAVETTE